MEPIGNTYRSHRGFVLVDTLGRAQSRRDDRRVLYPALTLEVIIVTANHFIFDAVFGVAALTLAIVLTGHRPPTDSDNPNDKVTLS